MNNEKIPVYKLYKGIDAVIIWIREKLMQRDNPNQSIIISIAGGSSTGKSTQVSEVIKEAFFGAAKIINADNYYYGSSFMRAMKEKGINYNWDQPEAVNLPLLCEHILALKDGKSIPKLKYSFINGEAIPDGEIKPARIIIIEGLFVLEDMLLDLADIKVFVDTGMHGRLVRRILRDVKRAGQKPIDISKYFASTVNPMHELYIENKKLVANLIIKNEYSPSQIAPEQSGLREFQLKFLISDGTDNYLNRIEKKIWDLKVGWGENAVKMVSVTLQIDTYYNPPDRNLIETGEMLRIREEYHADEKIKIILTFKVIKENPQFIERLVPFEFELEDEETTKLFLSLYKDTAKIITKRRRLYKFDAGRFAGISFTLDYVCFNKPYRPEWFLEIRFNKDHTEEQVKELVEADFGGLGLKMADAIKKSYFEM